MRSVLPAIEIAAGKVGSMRKLAKALGIHHTTLYDWRQVPAEHALRFEELSGISRYTLRPDVYGAAPERVSAP